MASQNEKRQQEIDTRISSSRNQNTGGRLGIVMSYDQYKNTASVLISKQNSNEIEQVIKDVQCPVTLGVQTPAPTPGRPCWVIFKDGNLNQGLISHFYNHMFAEYDYSRHYQSGFSLPSYLMG